MPIYQLHKMRFLKIKSLEGERKIKAFNNGVERCLIILLHHTHFRYYTLNVSFKGTNFVLITVLSSKTLEILYKFSKYFDSSL